MKIKEYIKVEQYNYLDDNESKNMSTTKLHTSYDSDNTDDLLKLTIIYETLGQSISNYIYIDSDYADELIYSLVQFRKDVESKKFEREHKKD